MINKDNVKNESKSEGAKKKEGVDDECKGGWLERRKRPRFSLKMIWLWQLRMWWQAFVEDEEDERKFEVDKVKTMWALIPKRYRYWILFACSTHLKYINKSHKARFVTLKAFSLIPYSIWNLSWNIVVYSVLLIVGVTWYQIALSTTYEWLGAYLSNGCA